MRHVVLTHAFIWLFAAAVFTLMTAAPGNAYRALTPDRGKLVITITPTGIEPQLVQPGQPGLYHVTIKNDSCETRGIVMKGIDRCCSRFVRYTKVLQPGQQETFRWYFPANRTIRVRDLMACQHKERSCVVASFGRHQSVMEFTG